MLLICCRTLNLLIEQWTVDELATNFWWLCGFFQVSLARRRNAGNDVPVAGATARVQDIRAPARVRARAHTLSSSSLHLQTQMRVKHAIFTI